MKTYSSGAEVIDQLAGTKILLAFSCGKDSLATWLKMRDRVEIVPVYKYLVPGLEFVEQAIDYYQRWFGVRIHQVPHDSLLRWLNNLTFQAPENCLAVENAGLSGFKRDDWRKEFCAAQGMPPDTWLAVGTRACDSPQRRLAFSKHGPYNQTSRNVYPVWDMTKADVVETIRASGCKLPAEYRIWGRSFDGIDFRFLWGIKQYWPRDYAKILEWFPMAELEIKRYEYAHRTSGIRAAGV